MNHTDTMFCDGCEDFTGTITVKLDGETLNLCVECH